jgi:FtsH-binding integral membrane protein
MIKNVYRSAACTETFSTLSHRRHEFRKKFTEYKMCDLIFSSSFVWIISYSKKNWARYARKCVLVTMENYSFLSVLNENLFSSHIIS